MILDVKAREMTYIHIQIFIWNSYEYFLLFRIILKCIKSNLTLFTIKLNILVGMFDYKKK